MGSHTVLARKAVVSFVLVLVVGLVFNVASAGAAVVTSSAVDHDRTADLVVTLASDDPTSTVVLMADGRAIETRPGRPGEVLDFGEVGLGWGTHQVWAALRTRDGVVRGPSTTVRCWGLPDPARLISPAPNGYHSRYVTGTIKAGFHTTTIDLYINGRFIRTIAVQEDSLQQIGTLALGAGVNTFELVAKNPMAETRTTCQVTRLDFPWPTCIVIDKSDFKLYWVRNGVLVKAYPIAIGKAHTATPVGIWRIGNKYHTSPTSVYGPRKMRLYRQTSSGFVHTAYNIHGTNQEWVIGTMASHGCIRMYNRDVLELFPQVPLGTMVQTRQ